MACLDEVVIARYARGESPAPEAAIAREHLKGCAGCQAKVLQEQERLPSAFPGSAAYESSSTQITEPANQTESLSSLEDFTGNEPPMEPVPALERGAPLGRYLVVDRLGEGGMGVVYAAYDPELNRKVAIKLLRAFQGRGGGANPEGQARLLREAQAMARVQHPHVISVYDVGTLGDRVFVAMEFVEGPTLARWVRERPRPWREVLAAFLDAGKGLAAAHQVGLVHRDFKPENVLMGKDGRVRVMDFGLARLDSSRIPGSTLPSIPALKLRDAATSGPQLAEAITQAGEVMGTPQYMAPEQRLGLVADARSDQFSFCAALYWALYREPPFDPMQLAAAAIEATEATPSSSRPLNFTRTVIKEPPKEPAVPAWIKRAMLRGLELSPQARFPSMQALLAELDTDPWVARRRWLAVAAGLVLGVAGVGALSFFQLSHRAQLCGGAEHELTGVWDTSTQHAIETAFAATGKPYATASYVGLRQLLDTYSSRWVSMKREACEDTRVRGVQTEQLLALRTICLDQRLKQLRALTRLLSSADAQTVEKAVDVARALPSLQRCADVEALSAPVSPPEDPAAQVRLEKVGSTLASAKVLGEAGKYKEALELAQAAAGSAEELHYLPVQADALQQLGWLQVMTGDEKQGKANLAEAVWTAESARYDEIKALAAIRLVYVTGNVQVRPEETQTWASLAKATLNRIGGNDELQLELLSSIGAWYTREGHYAEAQVPYERAAALAQRSLGPTDPKRALVLASLGIDYQKQGENDKARRVLLEALEIIEKAQGPDHPSAAYAHKALAEVFEAEEDYSSAMLHARKALEIWEASFGPRHKLVGNAYDTIAAILFHQETYLDALAQYQQALEVKLAALGPDHPELFYTYDGLGQTQVRLGKYADALPNLERALALRGSETNLPGTRFALAQALWETRRDRARARTLARQAQAELRKVNDPSLSEDVASWLDEHPGR